MLKRLLWGLIGVGAVSIGGYQLIRYWRPRRSSLVFNGMVALIADAHSANGMATAVALAQRGSRLALAGRDPAQLEALRLATEPYAADVITIEADWRTGKGRASLMEDVFAHYDRVDLALVDLADLPGGVLERHIGSQHPQYVADQLASAVSLTALLIPGMRAQRSGILMYRVPHWGRLAAPGMSLYAMATFGILGFAETLRHELLKSDIMVETVIDGLPASEAAITAENALNGLLNNQATVVCGDLKMLLLIWISENIPGGLAWYWRWANSPDWLASTEVE